jgi:hypothetical protein
MLVLDHCDAFGSVLHVQLRDNLTQLGLHPVEQEASYIQVIMENSMQPLLMGQIILST